MENDTSHPEVSESEKRSLFRQVLDAVRRQVKSLYIPFEHGDTAFDRLKKVMMGVFGTLFLIIVSPVVLFILVVTLLIAL